MGMASQAGSEPCAMVLPHLRFGDYKDLTDVLGNVVAGPCQDAALYDGVIFTLRRVDHIGRHTDRLYHLAAEWEPGCGRARLPGQR
jgi:hypothetical protein